MSVVLSSWERGMNANVVHAALGRQVSTWTHMQLKVEASVVLEVRGSFFHPLS